MNIADFLIEDHRRIRAALSDILLEVKQGFPIWGLRGKMRDLIAHLQLHEETEDLLFTRLLEETGDPALRLNIEELESEHREVWQFLELTLDAFNSESPDFIRRAFLKLHGQILAHISHEEDRFFPGARKALSEEVLSELGEKAGRAYSRYEHFLGAQ